MDILNSTSESAPAESNGCQLTDEEINNSYNLTLHIISIFVLLIVSVIGASFSVISTNVKTFRVNPIIINTGKFFGSGVVLATGFIHILPEAMEKLSDPCLPDSWNEYSAFGGLFAMLAALGMQLIEFLAHQRNHPMKNNCKHVVQVKSNTELTPNEQPINSIDRVAALHENDNNIELAEANKTQLNSHIEIPKVKFSPASAEFYASHGHQHSLTDEDKERMHKVSTYILEFGIALHSILIGLTLGTTTDSFVALFIALSFHQFFEAIALGAQIAHLKTSSLRSHILMIIFFSLTTPVGIAIGIGIHHSTYSPKSVSSLLTTGILDSLSAGILIYVSLVNLINADMGVHAHTFYSLNNRLKFLYFIALYLGVAAMAVIGRWA